MGGKLSREAGQGGWAGKLGREVGLGGWSGRRGMPGGEACREARNSRSDFNAVHGLKDLMENIAFPPLYFVMENVTIPYERK